MPNRSKTGGETAVLADVMEQLRDAGDGEQVSVGEALSAFEDRTFGALLTVVGLVAALPVVGSIPGVSVITGTLVILIAGQFLLGRSDPWIPDTLRERAIEKEALDKAIDKSKPVARWFDSLIKPRLEWAIGGAVQKRITALVVCALGLTMVPLALVPWGVQPPATAILLFGIALIGRDGLLAIASYVLTLATVYTLIVSWGVISSAVGGLFGG